MKKYLPILNRSSSSKATVTTSNGQQLGASSFSSSNFKKQESSIFTSDHLAKVNLLHEYISCKNRTTFCKQNMLNKNNIKRAVLVRDQLEDYLKQIVVERNKR